jgi:hypothetical protein
VNAMRHVISPALLAASFRHCGDDEYRSFLTGLPVTACFRRMRLRYRRNFIERWPRIEDWFNAPFRNGLVAFAARRRRHRAIRPPIERAHIYSTSL